MTNEKARLERIIKAIKETAENVGIHPSEVTKAQLKTAPTPVSDWDLKQIQGGLSAIKRAHFPMTTKDLVVSKEIKDTNKYIRELETQVANKLSFENALLKSIEDLAKNLPKMKTSVAKPKKDKKKKNMTIELMLSDIHYGKLTDSFNLDICRTRMRELVKVFLEEITQKQKSFNVEKLVVALIGDIIESFTMHGLESAVGCEFGNSRQVQEAIESLFYDVIVPVAETGIQVVVPSVPGNHDRADIKKTMNMPGENNLSWIIYKMLETLSKAHKLKNVSFEITRDSFVVLDIYGTNVLYEHGDELKNVQKGTILNHMEKRGRQVNKQIHMIRVGHWHEYVCFNRGQAIVNESVCGQDSYARVKGFSSTAGQTINFYVQTKDRPTSFYYSFPVYLG